MNIAHSNDTTSKAAADSIEHIAPTMRKRVFDAIRDADSKGMTDDELEVALDMTHQSASARRRELVKSGDVIDSGKTRETRSGRSAIVWVTSDNVDLESFIEAKQRRKRDKVRRQITRKLRKMSHDDLVSLLGYMEE